MNAWRERMYRVLFQLLLLVLFPLSNGVLAAGPGQMETMVVTASRTPLPLSQAGSSISVITAEQLQKRQVAPVSEILRDIPGLMVNRSGVLGTQTQVRVRGAEANQVLVFIDGVEANDPASDDAFDFAHLLSSDIERIEVIRGPQSALWGSDALAGVINIMTKRGKGAPKITGFAEGGSFGTLRGGGSIGASQDNFNFELNGAYLTSGGENISRQGNENDGYSNSTLSFSAGYSPLDNLSFDIVGRRVEATSEFDDVDFLTALPADTNDKTKSTQNYGRITAKLALLDRHWEHIISAGLTITGNDNISNQMMTGSTAGEKIKFDYQTNFFLDTPAWARAAHVFTFAFEREIEKYKQRGMATVFGDPNQDQEITTNSVIGEYRARFWQRFSISGSVRHDGNNEFKNATTYRINSAYEHTETDTNLHVSYGTGIKNPTFVERFGFFPLSFFGNADLRPEQSRGWEIGIDQAFFNGIGRLGLTYFMEELDNEINGFVFDPALGGTGGFTARNMLGTSKRRGAEIIGGWRLSENLLITASYTYTHSTQPDPMGRQVQEIRRPRHLASANLDYNFFKGKADININVNYNGSQEDDWFITFPATRVKLDSFILVSLAASCRLNEHVTLFGRVENLLDERYEETFGYRSNSRGIFAGVKMALQP